MEKQFKLFFPVNSAKLRGRMKPTVVEVSFITRLDPEGTTEMLLAFFHSFRA